MAVAGSRPGKADAATMSSSSVVDVPGLSAYPMSDQSFRRAVETSYRAIDGHRLDGVALLDELVAPLRLSYPLSMVQLTPSAGQKVRPVTWEAFRDETVLDDELVRRGTSEAAGQLYDRHGELAYDIAIWTAGTREGATDAVVAAFRTPMVGGEGQLAVRVRVARAARDAALEVPQRAREPRTHGDPLSEPQRAVVQLAHAHRFTGPDIAAVLRMDIREVRRLANDGLGALAASRGTPTGTRAAAGMSGVEGPEPRLYAALRALPELPEPPVALGRGLVERTERPVRSRLHSGTGELTNHGSLARWEVPAALAAWRRARRRLSRATRARYLAVQRSETIRGSHHAGMDEAGARVSAAMDREQQARNAEVESQERFRAARDGAMEDYRKDH